MRTVQSASLCHPEAGYGRDWAYQTLPTGDGDEFGLGAGSASCAGREIRAGRSGDSGAGSDRGYFLRKRRKLFCGRNRKREPDVKPEKAAPEELQKIKNNWKMIVGQTEGMFKSFLSTAVPKYNGDTGENKLFVEFTNDLAQNCVEDPAKKELLGGFDHPSDWKIGRGRDAP